MAAISGKYGEAVVAGSDVSELLDWDLEYGPETLSYNSKSGGGAAQTVDGAESGSGTINVNIDPDGPTGLQPGVLVDVVLYNHKDGDVKASGTVRLGKLKTGAKLSGEIQKIAFPFTAHGHMVLTGY